MIGKIKPVMELVVTYQFGGGKAVAAITILPIQYIMDR